MDQPDPPLAISEKAGLAAALLLCLLACNYAFLGHYVDDIVWVLLSRNMAQGSLMAAWSYFPRVETSATWGFSLLLVPVSAVFGHNALALKLWSALLSFAGMSLFYLSTRGLLPPPGRLVYLLALFCNNFYLAFSGNVISEAGYLLIFGAGIHGALRRKWLWRSDTQALLALGALTALLILTRVIGMAFFAAALWEMLRTKRFRDMARYGAVVAIGILPYFLINKIASGTATYHALGWEMLRHHGGVSAWILAMGGNCYFCLKGLALLTFLYFPSAVPNIAWLKAVATAALVGVAGAGAWRSGRAPGGRFLCAYFLIYGLVCVSWPYQAARFVLPVFPLFLLWFLTGFRSGFSEKAGRYAWAILGVLILGSNLREVGNILRTSWTRPADMPHRSYSWLREHSAPEDLIVSMDIARIRYYADRRGIHSIPADSLAGFVRGAEEMKPRYFFLKEAEYVSTVGGLPDPTALQHARLAEYLGRGGLFRLVYENPEEKVRVYAPAGSGAPL